MISREWFGNSFDIDKRKTKVQTGLDNIIHTYWAASNRQVKKRRTDNHKTRHPYTVPTVSSYGTICVQVLAINPSQNATFHEIGHGHAGGCASEWALQHRQHTTDAISSVPQDRFDEIVVASRRYYPQYVNAASSAIKLFTTRRCHKTCNTYVLGFRMYLCTML